MSKKLIITVGREYGSGGRIISTKLAKRLGIKFYDKDLIEKATVEAGLDPSVFNNKDEKAPGLFITPYAPTKEDQLYMAQAAYIKKLADADESCLIVGRCANSVLEGREDVLNLFIYAPMDYKVKLCMERLPMSSEEQARKECAKADKHRKKYYEYFTEYQWGSKEGYDLLIDSSILGIDGTVDVLADIIKKKMEA